MSIAQCDRALTRKIEATFALEKAVAATFPMDTRVVVRHGFRDAHRFFADVVGHGTGYYAGYVVVRNRKSGLASRRYFKDIEVVK